MPSSRTSETALRPTRSTAHRKIANSNSFLAPAGPHAPASLNRHSRTAAAGCGGLIATRNFKCSRLAETGPLGLAGRASDPGDMGDVASAGSPHRQTLFEARASRSASQSERPEGAALGGKWRRSRLFVAVLPAGQAPLAIGSAPGQLARGICLAGLLSRATGRPNGFLSRPAGRRQAPPVPPGQRHGSLRGALLPVERLPCVARWHSRAAIVSSR